MLAMREDPFVDVTLVAAGEGVGRRPIGLRKRFGPIRVVHYSSSWVAKPARYAHNAGRAGKGNRCNG